MDFRTAVNPTYYTAQATLFMLAGAGNTDAQEFIRDMGIQNTIVDKGKGQASPLSEADLSALKVGTGLAVEARYASISRLLGEGGYRNVLDIACGFTPKRINLLLFTSSSAESTLAPICLARDCAFSCK